MAVGYEERIITESVASAGFVPQAAQATPFEILLLPARSCQAEHAQEGSSAPALRHRTHHGDQFRQVRRAVGLRPGVVGRLHPRLAAEGVDAHAAVIGQRPRARGQHAEQRARLLARVAAEGPGVLNHGRHAARLPRGMNADPEPRIRREVAQFGDLMGVARCEEDADGIGGAHAPQERDPAFGEKE